MKILGIGNAIVDVICKIDDNFLIKNGLVKSTMKLVDEKEFEKLLENLKIEKTISGGSVANSIVGLSQLGNEVGFIGKVNDDDLGKKYSEGLEKEKVQDSKPCSGGMASSIQKFLPLKIHKNSFWKQPPQPCQVKPD